MKDTETTTGIYNVDLQVKVLAVSYLNTAQDGSLGSTGAKCYLQVGSVSLRTFYLYLCFLPKRYMDGAGRPNEMDISGLLSL